MSQSIELNRNVSVWGPQYQRWDVAPRAPCIKRLSWQSKKHRRCAV